ncbi:apolipoprotein C-I [Labrus bergylta]|uniref:Apolipoprotein C-I, acidic form-like n=1 Tax=Labrus bergylta TaxID=56723 RepID=A0A3Q3E7A6_9LABR|nr:apolipoprotein C-I, acidic form-like [Labrus bergylta]
MRLFLAVAVLMLAFVAYTEAQEEETVQQKLSNLGDQMTEMGKNLAEKAKTTFDELSNSQFASDTRDWFTKHIEQLKSKFGDVAQ